MTLAARLAALIFGRIVCPFAMMLGGIRAYASCMVMGFAAAARLLRCQCGDEATMVSTLAATMQLYASAASKIVKVDARKIIEHTRPAWQALLALTFELAGRGETGTGTDIDTRLYT